LETTLIDCGLGLIGRGSDNVLDLTEIGIYVEQSQNSTYCSPFWRAP